MQRNRPPSEQAISVLLTLAEDPAEWRHGYDLCQETGLKAGTMYPILMRLADRGWLRTKWETETVAGRPPRHLYCLTETGLQAASEFAAGKVQAARQKSARLRPHLESAG